MSIIYLHNLTDSLSRTTGTDQFGREWLFFDAQDSADDCSVCGRDISNEDEAWACLSEKEEQIDACLDCVDFCHVEHKRLPVSRPGSTCRGCFCNILTLTVLENTN